jgi:hypothetical protein
MQQKYVNKVNKEVFLFFKKSIDIFVYSKIALLFKLLSQNNLLPLCKLYHKKSLQGRASFVRLRHVMRP